MSKGASRLTVYFEDPFWVGVFECEEDGKLSVCKVTFGAEPKDYEIKDYILKEYFHLIFSPEVTAVAKAKLVNPKRRQREVTRHLADSGIGTKAQQALKLLQEQNKLERKVKSKEQKLAEESRQFELKQQKRKEKHRGH